MQCYNLIMDVYADIKIIADGKKAYSHALIISKTNESYPAHQLVAIADRYRGVRDVLREPVIISRGFTKNTTEDTKDTKKNHRS